MNEWLRFLALEFVPARSVIHSPGAKQKVQLLAEGLWQL